MDIYFDDATFSHTPSPIVSVSDYFPFGLTYNVGDRNGSYEQVYKYNGKEVQNELDLGWMDYGARMYMPEIGRWGVVDPLAEFTIAESVYVYASNNPMLITDPSGMLGQSSMTYERSTYINPSGIVIEHLDDGDDNVYLVLNPDCWDGNKKDLLIVGKEDPRKKYKKGDQYSYYHCNEEGYDIMSLLNYINNITASSGSAIATERLNAMLGALAVNFVPVWDESGKVIGLVPKGTGAFAYKSVRFVRGVFEFIGPTGDVVFTLYNINKFNNGKMSGGELTYNLVSTGAGMYITYAVGATAGVMVGTIFLIGEGLYESIQTMNEIHNRNRTSENTLNSWNKFNRRMSDYVKSPHPRLWK